MSIRDLFRKPADSVEGLQEKHRAISEQKKSLEKQADGLRAESLRADIPDISNQIADLREEIRLSDIAMAETKKQLQAMLEKKIEMDHGRLDDTKRQYEAELSDLTSKAGETIGRGIKSLQSTNLSLHCNLAEALRNVIVQYGDDYRFKEKMAEFFKSYSLELDADDNSIDFKKWRGEILKAEKLQPGSLETQAHVKGRIMRLLSATD